MALWSVAGPGAAGALEPAQFASGVSLVEVYATVTDAKGEPVTGLNSGDFSVEEDGEPQGITAFSAGEFPLAVSIGLDRSFSMSRERLAGAAAAARAFISALRPVDQVMVLAIGSETEVLAPWSADRKAALAALDRVEPWGTTPLFDATLQALDAVQQAAGRRALILLSDGDDRYSRAIAADVVQEARQKDVLIYPVALGRTRPPLFAELAVVTGGRSFYVPDTSRLPTTLAAIARELRFQYLIGYVPARPAEGEPEWRSIRVTVNRPGVNVRARDGYLAR
jgi:Ca-activated chloride channel family protein